MLHPDNLLRNSTMLSIALSELMRSVDPAFSVIIFTCVSALKLILTAAIKPVHGSGCRLLEVIL